MMTLRDLLPSIKSHERRVCEADVSAFFDSADPVIIRYREPDTAMLFQVAEDADAIRTHFPDFPATLAASVALLAICHEAPPVGEEASGKLYARLAQDHRDLFLHLLRTFTSAFPDATRFGEAVEREKKD